MTTTAPTTIHCFTDVMCGFSYVAAARLAQIKADFGDRVRISRHFMSVYGNVRRKLDSRATSDSAFGAMVRDVLSRYDHVEVHPELFCRNLPTSSVPAHLYLRAVKLLEDDGVLEVGDGPSPFERLTWELQLAFFRDLRDISRREVLDEVAGRLGIPGARVARVIDDGRAFAELSSDGELQRTHGVLVTPSLVLDDGRQILNGNVGYRVIEANIRELVSTRVAGMSWC
jgi:predicted DsbA family dithiol-disulfide isomerase